MKFLSLEILEHIPPKPESASFLLVLSPEEKTETHSSILAWKIPWTEEPGGLQSMESQKSHPGPCVHTPTYKG